MKNSKSKIHYCGTVRGEFSSKEANVQSIPRMICRQCLKPLKPKEIKKIQRIRILHDVYCEAWCKKCICRIRFGGEK